MLSPKLMKKLFIQNNCMHSWLVCGITYKWLFSGQCLIYYTKTTPKHRSTSLFYVQAPQLLGLCLICVSVLWAVLSYACFCYSTTLAAPSSDLSDVNRLPKSVFLQHWRYKQYGKISINRHIYCLTIRIAILHSPIKQCTLHKCRHLCTLTLLGTFADG